MATAVASFVLSLLAGVGLHLVADKPVFQPHVMGTIDTADGNQPLPPPIQGAVVVSPSPQPFVMGRLAPMKPRRTSVSKVNQHR